MIQRGAGLLCLAAVLSALVACSAADSRLKTYIEGLNKYVGSLALTGNPTRIVIGGNYAYLVGDAGTVTVIDIAHPEAPREVSSFDLVDHVNCMVADAGHLYVSIGQSLPLRVYDMADPANPSLVGSLDTGAGLLSMVLVGGQRLYGITGSGGFQVIDVTVPGNPVAKGSCIIAGSPIELACDGNRAYVAAGNGGVSIIDVVNPDSPQVVGHYATAYSAIDVCQSTLNQIIVLLQGRGLAVLTVADPTAPLLASELDAFGYDLCPVDSQQILLVASGLGFYTYYAYPAEVYYLASYQVPYTMEAGGSGPCSYDAATSGDYTSGFYAFVLFSQARVAGGYDSQLGVFDITWPPK